MKKLLLLSIFVFAFGNLASVCQAGQTTYLDATFMCFETWPPVTCWHWDQKWYRFMWTSTPLYVPPNNKEIDGSIWDDRRCRSDHTGTHTYSWTDSEGRTVQMSHSWGTYYGITLNVLGLGSLACGNQHTNSWSWACHTHAGTTHTDNVTYTTPEGEYGFHDIEWACAGTQYDGIEFREFWYPNMSGTLCHFDNLGAKTTKKRTRSIITSAGDWHSVSKTCLVSRGGCGTANMACNDHNCTGTNSDGSDCCHQP